MGKGGRLGTIAFLGNVLNTAVRTTGGFSKMLGSTLEILGTAILLAMSVSALRFSRTTPVAADKAIESKTGGHHKLDSITRAPHNLRRLAQAFKAVVLVSSAARLFTSTTSAPIATVLQSLMSMVLAAVTVQKSAGVVLPVALVGLLGSWTPVAAPIYLGTFVGMTKMPQFQFCNTVQACTLATLLLHLGVLDGFGGKLGLLSFLGVLFGM